MPSPLLVLWYAFVFYVTIQILRILLGSRVRVRFNLLPHLFLYPAHGCVFSEVDR